MDTIDAMRTFVRVAQRQGFARASRELRVSPATVTKQVAALEGRIGTRLFDRTTRRVVLTEAGRIYLERCLECLQAVDDADASISELSAAPRGKLRISAPVDLQAHLSRVLGSFMRMHPQISVDLRLSNRAVDLVNEGFDVAIRAAATLDGPYVARLLTTLPFGVYASPRYLREHGRPRTPADLARHRAVIFVEPRPWDTLVFERGRRQVRVNLVPAFASNSGDACRDMVVAGTGVVAAPSFLMQDAVEEGHVEQILRDWTLAPLAKLWAVYPQRRFLPAKVRLFVDALRTAFGGAPERQEWASSLRNPRR
jgi:DNA-binding transcriptional LysR family regulator